MAKFVNNNAKNKRTAICFLSWTTIIILAYLLRIKSTLTQDIAQLTKLQKRLRKWCQFARKSYFMPRNCKSKPMIRAKSLITIYRVRSFGSMSNISGQSAIKNSKPGFLGRSKFFILVASSFTCLNYAQNGIFVTFFISYCLNKIQQVRCKITRFEN